MSWDSSLWGRLAGSSIYCTSTDPEDLGPKTKPWEQRGLTLYTLASRLEAKRKAQPTYGCMWLHWIFHFPRAMWPLCFNSLSFISLVCHSFLLSRCQNTSLSVSFLASPFLLQEHLCMVGGIIN
jgi:hypothetical protein